MNMMDSKRDMSQWRLDEEHRHLVQSKPPVVAESARQNKRYIKAPLPYGWIATAANLPAKTLHLAMAIRYLVGVTKSSTIKLSYKYPKEFGVGVKAFYSALTNLEQAGLISVQRSKGRSPIITVLNAADTTNSMDSGEHVAKET